MGEELQRFGRGRVAELVGPAGSGKTTLLRALCRHPGVIAAPAPDRRDQLAHHARHLALLAPALLSRPSGALAFGRRQARAMAYLGAWPETLRRLALEQGRLILMDHGPVFRLAWLREFGAPFIPASPGLDRWWEACCGQWNRSLDALVWLDAPDARLIERVRRRPVPHPLKDCSDAEAHAFLARYRRAFETVVRRFEAGSGPRVLRFDTERLPLDVIVQRVLEALDAPARAA